MRTRNESETIVTNALVDDAGRTGLAPTTVEVGPTEAMARALLGPRPPGVTESTYLYAVREMVDTVVARREAFAAEAAQR